MSDAVPLGGRVVDGVHELLQRVYFEDTDFSGRIYHARYLHFLERGRSEFLRTLGIHHRELAAEGLAFAVRRMAIEFLAPAGIDDVIRIVTRLERAGGARIVLDQAIECGSRRIVSAQVTVALVGLLGRAVRLPASIRDALTTDSKGHGDRNGR